MPNDKEQKVLNLFLFHGEDSFSANEKLNFWKEEFVKKYGDNDLEVIDGETLDTTNFTTDITTIPFLSEKRLTIVKNFLSKTKAEEQKKITEYLEDLPDSNVLIFFENTTADKRTTLFKKLSSLGKIEYFAAPSPHDVLTWINKKAITLGSKISPRTSRKFIEYCGTDFWHLSQELQKLTLYANGQEITPEMIEMICIPEVNATIFNFTDSIGSRDRKKSLKTLKLLKNTGEEIPYIFHMIVRQFRLIIQIKDLLEKKETPFSIAKKLKQNPYVVKIVSSQCKNFTFGQLKNIHANLLKIDVAFKTGQIKTTQGDTRSFELALEKFIINN